MQEKKRTARRREPGNTTGTPGKDNSTTKPGKDRSKGRQVTRLTDEKTRRETRPPVIHHRKVKTLTTPHSRSSEPTVDASEPRPAPTAMPSNPPPDASGPKTDAKVSEPKADASASKPGVGKPAKEARETAPPAEKTPVTHRTVDSGHTLDRDKTPNRYRVRTVRHPSSSLSGYEDRAAMRKSADKHRREAAIRFNRPIPKLSTRRKDSRGPGRGSKDRRRPSVSGRQVARFAKGLAFKEEIRRSKVLNEFANGSKDVVVRSYKTKTRPSWDRIKHRKTTVDKGSAVDDIYHRISNPEKARKNAARLTTRMGRGWARRLAKV